MHGLMPPGLDKLPGGKALEGLIGNLPGMHDVQLPGTDPGSASIHPIVSGDALDPVGRQVSSLISNTLPGTGPGMPSTGGSAEWNSGQPSSWAPGTSGPPPWAGEPHVGRSDFDGASRPEGGIPEGHGHGSWTPGGAQGENDQGGARWGSNLANGVATGVENLPGGVVRDAVTALGTAGRAGGLEQAITQSGRLAPQGEQTLNRPVAEMLGRDTGVRGTFGNRVALGDEAVPVDRQVTTLRPDGVQAPGRAATGAEPEVVEWRAGGDPDALVAQRDGQPVMQRDGQQNQIDPRMGWMSRVDQAPMLKLSLTVIPPVLREGEMVQSATRTALFRAVVDGQQAFIDSQGRIVGWAVRQDLAATYVAEVIQAEQLMQLPDGRQVIVDAQGRVRGAATGELLRPVKATLATDARQASDADERTLAQRAEAHLHAVLWSTVLPSCIGLILVVAAFLSAAAVGAMPWMVHVLFLAAAVGLGVFCGRTWKRCNHLPDGTVTKLPAITRRIRVLMALSCSAQGAGAVLLGTAAIVF